MIVIFATTSKCRIDAGIKIGLSRVVRPSPLLAPC